MSEDNMVERVARALFDDEHEPGEWDEHRAIPSDNPRFYIVEGMLEDYRGHARAAIEAMRLHIDENFERAVMWEGNVQHIDPVGEGWNQCLDEISAALQPKE